MVKLPPPVYAGNLDLHGMFLLLLYNVYLPKGIAVLQYESLYKTLVRIQAKHDHSARCFLTLPSDLADSISATNANKASSSAPGPGISARPSFPDQCGIKSSKDVFKMKRVWAKLTPEGTLEELFEGFFSFSVSFDSLYKKAGHGNGARYKYAFWAIRASTGADGSDVQGRP
ncbi:hypothetical protein PILCRDRAFT_84257 [Piloderma croceum F 1598]|uniref:Uncharacterized protein n=1 Tax=Piloderma croceum (strain F 1598) TaxID=765440 RepID=A0A0C3GHI5_PILCF|nr:hypothetical protein PILCRDRAFT_84257 [Piloderma croceum F 1598]